MTNKYAEGYPSKRYYSGCEQVDIVEKLAMERVCKLFNCDFANVQPHSGAQANQAVFFALLKPGDTFLGMELASGGHLTHGARPNQSGKWFTAVQYGVSESTQDINYEQVAELAEKHKPKLILAGGSAIPREINFKKMREIADSVGAYFHVDMAHFAGLVAGGVCANPIEYADVLTSTTHKTLRGPRGGIVLTNSEDIYKKINSSVFPGLQGGPLMHVIAAKAVAFGEALQPEFQTYCKQVLANAKILSEELVNGGVDIVTGGTDTHLLLADLRSKNVTGAAADLSLSRAHITCNKNSVPYDPLPPTITSGLRFGTSAGTTRGFKESEFTEIAKMILEVVNGLSQNGGEPIPDIENHVKARVLQMCKKFPIYPTLQSST
jgi:glycine hydroxymethyltransferase